MFFFFSAIQAATRWAIGDFLKHIPGGCPGEHWHPAAMTLVGSHQAERWVAKADSCLVENFPGRITFIGVFIAQPHCDTRFLGFLFEQLQRIQPVLLLDRAHVAYGFGEQLPEDGCPV